MPGLIPEGLGAFVLATALLALVPGPDNLFVLTQSALFGRRAGLIITLGLCTGLIVHTLAVVLGVAALFKASPLAFTLLKVAGAAYLLYLAWGTWHAGAATVSSPHAASTPPTLAALYRRGIIMNLSNPKVALFFLAFLPQFTQADRGALPLQLLWLGLLFILVAWVIFSLIALAAARIARRLRDSPGTQSLLHRLAALVFIGLALRLVSSSA